MKFAHIVLSATLGIALLVPTAGIAAEKAVNISLVTPISIARETDSVTAFRLNILYGKNTSVQVLDLGLVNHTTSGLSKGLQWGAVNIAEAVNYNGGSFEGVQWGFVNHTMNGDGLQLGFVNFAQKIHGIQIGFVNVISQDGFLPVLPIVNWSF